MYLLDTNILSATAPTKMKPDSELRAWIERNSEHLFLSVVTVLDLSHGLTWLRHHRATAKASRLEAWIDLVCFYYHARILPVDIAVALRAGALITAARGRGASVDTEDAVIAATAELNAFVILTENTRHFRPMGVAHVNPFLGLPPDAV